MPRPRDDPPDVPAHQDQAALSVSFDGRRCMNCGRGSNPPRHAVADFPDPTRDDPRGRERCLDCAASSYAGATPLDVDQARILALLLCGYDHEQIGRAVGRSVTGVEKQVERIRDEYDEGAAALAGLMQYL